MFKGQEYHSLGSLSEKVPIFSCNSLSKRYLIPGWRCGWLAIYDRQGLVGKSVSYRLSALVFTPSLLGLCSPLLCSHCYSKACCKGQCRVENLSIQKELVYITSRATLLLSLTTHSNLLTYQYQSCNSFLKAYESISNSVHCLTQ